MHKLVGRSNVLFSPSDATDQKGDANIWIITNIGFFSIVEKPWNRQNDELTVRARVHDDLMRLEAFLPSMGQIIESEDSDYRFRAVAPRQAVSAAMAKLAADIDYDNFKNEVASRQGHARAAIYSHVWHDLYGLQADQLADHLL